MATLNPLVSTEWLGQLLHDDQLRIADCRWFLDDPERGAAEYHTSHIPTSRYFSLDGELTGVTGPGRHPLPAAADFSRWLGSIGIGNEHTVVAYDDRGGAIAARLWWMLRSLGHDKVYVLDGGWTTWASEPRSVTTEVPTWGSATFTGADNWTGIIDRDRISASQEDFLLIDARCAERYSGKDEPLDPVAGHIPGARNVPYEGNVTDLGKFLLPEEVAKRFPQPPEGRSVVNYCGSGVTACHNVLALEVAGRSGSLLYPGSWSDWCTNGGAVATHTSK